MRSFGGLVIGVMMFLSVNSVNVMLAAVVIVLAHDLRSGTMFTDDVLDVHIADIVLAAFVRMRVYVLFAASTFTAAFGRRCSFSHLAGTLRMRAAFGSIRERSSGMTASRITVIV
jgi:hypothetical protein